MLNIKTLAILAIAGSAAATPYDYLGKYFGGDRGQGDDAAAKMLNIVTATETVTSTTTYTASSAPSSAVAVVAASNDDSQRGGFNFGNGNGFAHQQSSAPVAASTPTPAPVAAPQAPAASPSSAPVASSGGSSDSGYMGIVSTWRSKMGLSALTQSDTLQANALKTAQDGNGQMKHELNPGSFAQVLAPGSADEFEKVFVGGWLCEVPSTSGLNGICNTMSQGWAYDGQTGHNEILTSTAYSKIGCALADGIWACDLA